MRYRLAICPLWLRCIVSTTTGQLTYTIIWIGLFFGTSINTELLTRIIDNYGFKVAYAACLIPVTYLIVAIYRSRKPHYQTATSS
ncbi:VUT family protein [Vibrio sp. PP-XX7]